MPSRKAQERLVVLLRSLHVAAFLREQTKLLVAHHTFRFTVPAAGRRGAWL
jgi:hypothetical protein